MTIKSVYSNDKNRIRRVMNRNSNPVITGDADGNVPYQDLPQSGMVNVRRQQADGQWGPPFLVRGSDLPGANIPGIPVELGIDKNRQQRIQGADFTGMQAIGVNPTQFSTTDPNANNNGFVNQQYLTTAYAQVVTGTLKVAIRGWIVKIAGVFYKLEGQVDFTGNVPSSGNHCIAAIAWKSDYSALEVQYSTAKNKLIPLTLDDVNEAWALMSDPIGNIPVFSFSLADGQTVLTDANRFLDLRNMINTGEDATSATVTTTNATATVIAAIPVAELSAVTITCEVAGAKSDYTASCGAVLSGTFRRASGGNVTLVGSVQGTPQEDSAGSPTVSMAVNTTDQTVEIKVTGVAAETWNWRDNHRIVRI